MGNLVLHLEYIFHIPVINFGPDVAAARAVDQLSGDAHLGAHLADASRQHIAHAKFGADPLFVDLRIAVTKARITGDDEKPVEFRKRRQDGLSDTIGENFLRRIAAQIFKR